jgi:hypothetical protein
MAKSTFAFLLSLLASVAAYSQSRLDRRLVTVPVEINNPKNGSRLLIEAEEVVETIGDD